MRNEIWLVLPIVNEQTSRKHLPAWKDAGYKIAALQDRIRFDLDFVDRMAQPWPDYAGYGASVNYLINHVVPKDVGLVVAAGEDMRPDPKHTIKEIIEKFFDRFEDGMGIMQPIGDDLPGTDRICGSPFIGRRFAARWNHGLGTFWPGYNHYYADEELFETTKKNGLLFQDGSMTHYHDHWTRHISAEKQPHHSILQERWDHDKALFLFRSAANFPGHQPLNQNIY